MAHKLNQTPIPYRLRVAIIDNSDATEELTNLPKNLEVLLDQNPENKHSLFSHANSKTKKILRSLKNTSMEFGFYSTLSTETEIECMYKAFELTNKKARIEVFPTVAESEVPDFLENNNSLSKYKELIALDTKPYFNTKVEAESQLKTVDNLKLALIDICDIVLLFGENDDYLMEYASVTRKNLFIYSQTKGFRFVSEEKINLVATKRLDRFNAYIIKEEVLESKIKVDLFHTFPKEIIPESSGERNSFQEKINNLKSYFYPFFARAEILSSKYQKLYKNTGRLAYFGAALAVFFVAVGLVYSFESFKHFNFVLEFILLLMILLIVLNAEKKQAHRSWLEARFLAERMRCARFFYIFSYDINENQLHPYAAGALQDDWVLRAFDEIWYKLQRNTNEKETKSEDFPALKKLVSESWLRDQIKFHRKGTKCHAKNNESYEFTGKAAYFFALICAFLHSIPLINHSIHYNPQLDAVLVLLALILPAIGATTEGVRRLMEFSRNAKRYKGMEAELEKIKFRFDHTHEPEQLKSIMHKTDQLMMREVQDWMLIQSTNKLEPVV